VKRNEDRAVLQLKESFRHNLDKLLDSHMLVCVSMQVREVSSGAVERKAREQLVEAARRREIDVVLVWRLDRWGRSMTDLLATLQELEHLGVGFVSLTEALDLTTPAGRAMAGLLAIFADYAERAIMQSPSAKVALGPASQWV
jgi:putative DNA-invertase from lambdoid prophage Rac